VIEGTLGNFRVSVGDPLKKRKSVLILLVIVIGIGQLIAIVNGI